MQKFKKIAKTVLVVAGTGAVEAFVRSNDISTPQDAAKTLLIGALGAVLFWLRSPRDEPDDQPKP